jgi:hypothetical protein
VQAAAPPSSGKSPAYRGYFYRPTPAGRPSLSARHRVQRYESALDPLELLDLVGITPAIVVAGRWVAGWLWRWRCPGARTFRETRLRFGYTELY